MPWYMIPCFDPHAEVDGIDMNAFRPRCKCISGFKSDNPNSGTFLRSNVDVCIRCTSIAECGAAPTISPTIPPTLSTKPSDRPSTSSSPSNQPTLTSTPTISPTTGTPTSKPTLSRAPSPLLTSTPTKIYSIFDGDSCKVDIECRSILCQKNVCHPKENLSLFIDNEEMGSYEYVPLIIMPNTSPSPSPSPASGVRVENASMMRVFGDVSKIFQLSLLVAVDKFTMLKFSAEIATFGTRFSVYINNKEPDLTTSDTSQCYTVSVSGEFEISVGSLMNDRQAALSFFIFRQESTLSSSLAETSISLLSIHSRIGTSIVDENGKCRDPNAETLVQKEGNVICRCTGAFVSSNGGKMQGDLDSCVECFSSTSCAFEGDSCSFSSECVWDSCINDRCAAAWPLSRLTIDASENDARFDYVGLDLIPLTEEGITSIGGIVTRENNVLDLYGDTSISFELQRPLEVNKYVDFKVNLETIEEVEQIKVCLYESNQDAFGRQGLVGEEFRCSILSKGNFELNVGGLFDDRIASLTHIHIAQRKKATSQSGRSIISNISIVTNEIEDIFDDSGKCADEKAIKIVDDSFPAPQCQCEDYFVASNGGKLLGDFDTCVQCLLDHTICARCLPEPHCKFDNEPCTFDKDCALGLCQDVFCRSGTFSVGQKGTDGSIAEWRARSFTSLELPNPGYPNGGILVRETISSVDMIGSTDSLYQFTSLIEIDAFARLQLNVDQSQASTSIMQVCRYEEIIPYLLDVCSSHCFMIQRGPNDIYLGDAFYYRKTAVKYIRFRQTGSTGSTLKSHTSSVTNIQFGSKAVTKFDDRGLCNDPNALVIQSAQGSRCKCFDGFVASSNGGKWQGDVDTCVSCFSIPACLSDRIHIISSHEKGTCVKPLEIKLIQGLGLARDAQTVIANLVDSQLHLEYYAGAFNNDKSRAGGIFVRSSSALFLHGHVWSIMNLMTSYVLDDYSRFRFSLTVSTKANFIGVCLLEDIDHGHNSCFQIYGKRQQSASDVGLTPATSILFFNVALGKPAAQSSTYSVSGESKGEAKNAVDGRVSTQDMDFQFSSGTTSTKSETNPWWEVDLEGMYAIREVIVYMGSDTFIESTDLSVILYDDEGSIVFRQYFEDPDEVINIAIPVGNSGTSTSSAIR